MLRLRYRRATGLFALAAAFSGANLSQAQLWQQFAPSDKKPAAPVDAPYREREAAPVAAGGKYALAQESGPWLIVTSSFSGQGADEQAKSLADELTTRYRMKAYIHEMDFKQTDSSPGRGLDQYGAPTRRRYQREEIRELAVLVGDFSSLDDPNAQKMLDYIKVLEPTSLNVDPEKSAQSMAAIKQSENKLLERLGKQRKRGPMGQAFFTRNPLLPREYFVPKGVDPFVAKMNEGVENSLLDCPGQYTIRIATFRGKSILQTSAKDDSAAKSFWNRRKANDENPLIEAAENAHMLTRELRAHGWDAYEFHDRTESVVTVGSFAQIAQQLPDGRAIPAPGVEKIVKTFGAAYDTPADPISGIGNDSTNQRLVAQQQEQVKMQISGQQGQLVPGMNPKHVKILKGSGKRAKVDRIIPLDINPESMEVPKRSISSAYAG